MPRPQLESPTYSGLHKWIRLNFAKRGVCEHCDEEKKTDWAAVDHANYTRCRDDYLELCRRCHIIFDDRMPPSQRGAKLSPAHIKALHDGHQRWRAEQKEAA